MSLRGRPAMMLLVAAFVGGCGADESDSKGGDDWGGQTGSLIPSCGAVPALGQDLSVPSIDSPLVIQMEACDSPLLAADVTLLDELGRSVPFELEVIGDVALVRTSDGSPLPPGEYTVRTPELEEPLVVVEPTPLPARLGELVQLGVNDCGAALELSLDPQALSYAPLLQIELSIDNSPFETWVDYGQLEVVEGVARFDLQPCEPMCFDEGTHRVTLRAKIVDEPIELDPVSADVTTSCSPEEAEGGCAVARPRDHRLSTSLGAAIVLAVASLCVRPRRRRAR